MVKVRSIRGEVVTIDDGGELVRYRHHQAGFLAGFIKKYGRTVQLQRQGNGPHSVIGVKLDE